MTVLLPDIPRGYTWSEEWKRKTLCNAIRKMPDRERNALLAMVQQHHGRPYAVALYREAMANLDWDQS